MEFNLKLRMRNISKKEIIDDMKRVAKLKEDALTAKLYAIDGRFGVNTVLRKFGSWNNALAEAGLSVSNRIGITEEELFENIANVWTFLGWQPLGREISKSENSQFSLGTYEKRFGSWNNALVSFMAYIEGKHEAKDVFVLPKNVRQKKTSPKINWRLRFEILVRDNCTCMICGASPKTDSNTVLHVDHVVPYSKGGETVLENLRTLCVQCNIGRSNQFSE